MLNTALKHIRRAPYQALTAVIIMTLTFFVATLLVVLAYSSSTLLHHYETSPQVIAYLKKDATADQIGNLQKKLEADPRVDKIRFVSKEQAMEIYKQATADKPKLAEFVSPKVFPASIEFSLKELSSAQNLIDEIGKNDAVDEIAFTANFGSAQNLTQVVQRLTRISNYIRYGGAATLAFLLLSSLLMLLVIIGMRISTRRDEIEILQLIGATAGFIRGPFVLEGIFYAITGALIGWLAAFLIVLYLSPSLSGYFAEIPFLPKNVLDLLALFGIILGGEFILAVLLGATGSFVAIRRYLKI